MQLFLLDQLIREDHLVRTAVPHIDRLDISELNEKLKATTRGAGCDAIDPRSLLASWSSATLKVENSKRRIAELATRDLACM